MRTYDVDPATAMPTLASISGVTTAPAPHELSEVVTYFDTADLRLLAAGITLQRRNGGDDGWHLERAGDAGDRRHVPRPADDEAADEVPGELLDGVRVLVRDIRVAPVAVLTSVRRVHRLLDGRGRVLAAIHDDQMTAQTSSRSLTVEQWREWRLEVIHGSRKLVVDIEAALVRAGARSGEATPKLHRALAESMPARPAWRDRPASGAGRLTTGDVLFCYLGDHLGHLEAHDQRLRAGDAEGVHQLRVEARRLRAALSSYAPVLADGSTRELRSELRWLGGVLAEARDAEVQSAVLGALIEDLPADVAGPVRDLVDDELRGRSSVGRLDAERALSSVRYFRLLDRLEALLATATVTKDGDVPARRSLPSLLDSDLHRLRKHRLAYERSGPGPERDEALHRVRKTAKRLRYAAESARPVYGKRAKKLARRVAALQEVLGDHQDCVMARLTLRRLALNADVDGQTAFTLGLLHARLDERAATLEHESAAAIAQLPQGGVRAWLRR
ncbi:MAG: CYTH and CHAD domain-containing protein [Nocardioides sp.]